MLPGYFTLSLGYCAAALNEEYVSTFFLPYLKCARGFKLFFLVWRSTGSFCRTPSFSVHTVKIVIACVYYRTDSVILNELFVLECLV